jgi:hypothetical protein
MLVVACLALSGLGAGPSGAVVMVFNDEAAYLSALTASGYAPMIEGFEDEAAWGAVRTVAGVPHTAASVSNLGITWTANTTASRVTTSSGAARSGQWGFYALPHGDPPLIGDGFGGTSVSVIYGVGGWIRTNTPIASMSLVLDSALATERPISFGNNADLLDTQFAFFAVIDTDGFTRFDYEETEFDADELKLIFADDFLFAVPLPEPDSMLPVGLLFVLGYLRNAMLGDRHPAWRSKE